MEGIQSCWSSCNSPSGPPAFKLQGQTARLSGLNLCQEQSTEIAIMTDEGDKVMLSTQQHAEAALLSYEHLAYKNTRYDWEEIKWVDFTMEREVVLAVEGELNEQEIADIQSLLKELGGMLQAFLTGENASDSSPEVASDLDRFSTISAFEADFEYQTSVQYWNVEADQSTIQTGVRPQLAGLAAPTDASTVAVSTPTPASAPTASEVGPERPVLPRTEAEQAAGKMAKRVNESGLQPKRFLKRLKKFLKSLLKDMLSNQVIDAEQAQLGERILGKFINEVRKSAGGVEVQMSRASIPLQSVSRLYEAKAEVKLQPAVEEAV